MPNNKQEEAKPLEHVTPIEDPNLIVTPEQERSNVESPRHVIRDFVDDINLGSKDNPKFYRAIRFLIKYPVFWFCVFWFMAFLADMGLKHTRGILCQLNWELRGKSHCEEVEEVEFELPQEKTESPNEIPLDASPVDIFPDSTSVDTPSDSTLADSTLVP